jgi:hypothetical protein
VCGSSQRLTSATVSASAVCHGVGANAFYAVELDLMADFVGVLDLSPAT